MCRALVKLERASAQLWCDLFVHAATEQPASLAMWLNRRRQLLGRLELFGYLAQDQHSWMLMGMLPGSSLHTLELTGLGEVLDCWLACLPRLESLEVHGDTYITLAASLSQLSSLTRWRCGHRDP